MKALLFSLLLALCGLSQAGTVVLQLPSTYAITGHSCAPSNAPHVSQGRWTDDGLYFEAIVFADTTCSSGGRGSRPHSYGGALLMTYDLGGNVVSQAPPGVLVDFSFSPWANPVYVGYEVSDQYRSPWLSDVMTLTLP